MDRKRVGRVTVQIVVNDRVVHRRDVDLRRLRAHMCRTRFCRRCISLRTTMELLRVPVGKMAELYGHRSKRPWVLGRYLVREVERRTGGRVVITLDGSMRTCFAPRYERDLAVGGVYMEHEANRDYVERWFELLAVPNPETRWKTNDPVERWGLRCRDLSTGEEFVISLLFQPMFWPLQPL